MIARGQARSQSTIRRRTDASGASGSPPPSGYARWTGRLLAMALQDVDVQYVWRFCASKTSIWLPASPGARAIAMSSRRKRPTWSVSISTRLPRRLFSVSMRSLDPGVGAGARLLETPERTRLDRREPRLQAARHHDLVAALEVAGGGLLTSIPSGGAVRVPRLHEPRGCRFTDRELHVVLDNLNAHKKCDRWLKKRPNVPFPFTPTRSS